MNSLSGNYPPYNPAKKMDKAIRTGFAILATLAIVGAAAWSTFSLFTLMTAASAPVAVALLTCGVLDVAWLASMMMLLGDTYGGSVQANIWSWATLVASAAVSFVHGYQNGGWLAAGLGVLLVATAKGLAQAAVSTGRPKMRDKDRQRLAEMAYQRRLAELDRREKAAALHDEYRWGSEAVETGSVYVPVSEPMPAPVQPEVKLDRLEDTEEDHFSALAWVNERPAAIEPPVPSKPELVPAEYPKVPSVEPQEFKTRAERVNHLAGVIRDKGGQRDSISLREVGNLFGIDPAKKATLSGLRKDAHEQYLANAKTGQYL